MPSYNPSMIWSMNSASVLYGNEMKWQKTLLLENCNEIRKCIGSHTGKKTPVPLNESSDEHQRVWSSYRKLFNCSGWLSRTYQQCWFNTHHTHRIEEVVLLMSSGNQMKLKFVNSGKRRQFLCNQVNTHQYNSLSSHIDNLKADAWTLCERKMRFSSFSLSRT